MMASAPQLRYKITWARRNMIRMKESVEKGGYSEEQLKRFREQYKETQEMLAGWKKQLAMMEGE